MTQSVAERVKLRLDSGEYGRMPTDRNDIAGSVTWLEGIYLCIVDLYGHQDKTCEKNVEEVERLVAATALVSSIVVQLMYAVHGTWYSGICTVLGV
jgi:hypothetical protein